MRLPNINYGDGITKGRQAVFPGLNHTLGAADGAIYDMANLTGDYYPVLSPRRRRGLYEQISQPGGMFAWKKLVYISGDGFYYDGVRRGTVTAGKKQMAAIHKYIIIMPDKAYYDTETEEFGNIETQKDLTEITFENGTYVGEEADANTISAAGVNWEDYFRAGDAVEIMGCTKHPENNTTIIIREIEGNKLHFYENSFVLDEDTDGNPIAYTESGNLTLRRTAPELEFICENENRLWGCKDNTIYACALGDPFNWNKFDGVATDSYAVVTGSAGEFTACCSFLGYPIFFKEDHIYKVYGSIPSNFQVMGSASMGVVKGGDKSLAVAGETLHYLSRAGFTAYAGGIPTPIGRVFGMDKFENAVAGSDAIKYYVSAYNRADEQYHIYVYDTQLQTWHIEDETEVIDWAYYNGHLMFLNTDGGIWTVDGTGDVLEDEVEWYAEFADIVEDDPNKKGVGKFQLRASVEPGAEVELYVMWDTDGQWHKVDYTIDETNKKTFYLSVIPHRVDHYRLKLVGHGEVKVFGLTREYYSGSEPNSTMSKR